MTRRRCSRRPPDGALYFGAWAILEGGGGLKLGELCIRMLSKLLMRHHWHPPEFPREQASKNLLQDRIPFLVRHRRLEKWGHYDGMIRGVILPVINYRVFRRASAHTPRLWDRNLNGNIPRTTFSLADHDYKVSVCNNWVATCRKH
ncbi:hypothetical protein GALMADRAFT_250735 [Galerina marginata CBS 339.88]|uniref:Uncharacterized protein n=1 Tax=Galerina marginata (strain CBS 339.88) TaxID=685588 RepID=A0A067T4T4_GALM3|nr:hypothetical protein GALMADRAFT_250735 [Galerina marginata CBS 339.88]